MCANGVLMWKNIYHKRKATKISHFTWNTHTHRSSSNSISIFLSLSFVSPFLPFLPLLCTLFVRLSRSHCAFLYDDFCCFAFHVSERTSVGIYMKILPFYLSTTTLLISPNRCLLFAKFLISHVSSSFFYWRNIVIIFSLLIRMIMRLKQQNREKKKNEEEKSQMTKELGFFWYDIPTVGTK